MSKGAAFSLVIVLLCLSMYTSSARREPVDKTEVHKPKVEGAKVEISCKGVSEEECKLMRSTEAAHLDYIYTQSHNP